MHNVAAIINPIPNLEDDPSLSVVAVEGGRHACMPFLQMPSVITNTDEHLAAGKQARSHRSEGRENVIVAIVMRQGIIHCNDGTVPANRCSPQCPHVVNAEAAL